MKEQDFIHDIREKTKDLPIPDSISPDAMKQMLEENKVFNEEDNTHFNTDFSSNKSSKSANYNRHIRRFATVACIALCLAGSIGVSQLLSYRTKDNTSSEMTSGTAMDDTISETKSKTSKEELASQTNLYSPASYEEYYNTMKAAYDSYYDSLSDVTTITTFSDDAIAESAVENSGSASLESADISRADDFSDEQQLSSAEEASASKEYSTTNTQEKTVDEGDIIKTDGTYIYKVISGFDHHTGYTTYKLTITKTDNGSLTTMTSFSLDDILKKSDDDYVTFQEFYLYNDQLVLMYSKANYNAESQTNNTYIVVYDITDKENPTMVKTLSQSGWYESSRISNGYLYTISNFNDTSLEDIKKYKNYIPYINGNPIACENIYYPEDILMETTHVITSINLDNPKEFTDTKAIPSTGSNYYVSDASIYLYTTLYSDVTKTEIMKVNYEKGKLTVGNSAIVTGYLYDSFALNESNGYLRIVATIPANNIALLRSLPDEDTSNTTVTEDVNALYILDENMELTGKITGIAPGETIYSARYMGDIGYFVTYENTDPLFSVDLSDPANPTIIGSLKITGFSEYLHFYSENTLLGIGQETDPKTQEFLGLKLSMFDISDPANVKEKDKYIIENSDFSEALYNHKAIMIDSAKNIFGFMYYGTTENDYNYKYFYVTYTYDEREGFIETASYKVEDGSEYESNAVRGLYIGDYFYLATNKSITSYEIGSQEPIATVYLK